MKYDLAEVAALLDVVEKAAGHPKLKPLADAAMRQLEAYADEHRPVKPTPTMVPVPEDGVVEFTGDDEPDAPTTNMRRL